MPDPKARWPELPLETWEDTRATLHMWTQVVGKICLALTPLVNHYWNVTFHLTPRGMITPLMTYGDRAFTVTFDFVEHRLVFEFSDGITKQLPLAPQTVAEFYGRVMDLLRSEKVDVHIWTMPVEVENPVRFEADTVHRSYDPGCVNAFWRSMLSMQPDFARFRSNFIGKCSPLHFFWGGFDLAQTRFSGRRAPERPGADHMTQESYSHEVISHGYWPGSGAVHEPALYSYAAPEPEGFRNAPVQPGAAYYNSDMGLFILPYEAIRRSGTPDEDLMAFFSSTYEAGANLGNWNRAELERR